MTVILYLMSFIIAAILLFFLATTVYAAVIAAPFVATPKRVIRKALEISSLKPGEKFYDLGCGNGQVLIIATRDFGAASTGFELSYQHCLLAELNIFIHSCSKTAKVFWKNFYNENLGEADVIFLWLTPRGNKKLECKFKKELKAGTRIVVYSSPLIFWKPERTVELASGSHLFFYIKK